MKKILLITCLICIMASTAYAKRKHHEKWYQEKWCKGKGETEVVMVDKTRCDCLTKTHAIEMDFAKKHYEALGQSLHYSRLTGKRAGIVLIVESEKDLKYWKRLNLSIKHFNLSIDVWMIDNREEE